LGVVGEINLVYRRKAAIENSLIFDCGIHGKIPSSPGTDYQNFCQKVSAAPLGLEIVLDQNPQ
jgi:hypothetical protein